MNTFPNQLVSILVPVYNVESYLSQCLDSYTSLVEENGVAIFSIEELDILSPKDKSYVAVDDMYCPTNIIEKNVVGHYISAGGYYIQDATAYRNYYDRLYLSHIIYAMLLDKKTFRPMIVEEYKDWGTSNDLMRYK